MVFSHVDGFSLIFKKSVDRGVILCGHLLSNLAPSIARAPGLTIWAWPKILE